MDHIDRHPDSTLLPIEVPYVCGHLPVCGAADFPSWAGRLDWWFRTENTPLEEFAARLQSWLYFGLLCAFLGKDIPRTEILRESNAGPNVLVLDSFKVLERLHDWDGNEFERHGVVVEGLDEDDIDDRLNRRNWLPGARRVLSSAYDAMNRFVLAYLLRHDQQETIDGRDGTSKPDLLTEKSYAVIFAIDVLIDTLEATLDTFPYTLGIKDVRRCCLVATIPAFRNPIAKTGRCKSLAWRLQPSSTEWYRLMSLPLSGQWLDHEKDCTEQTCFHHGKKTPTLHREDCARGNSCRPITSNDYVVKQCIVEDKIPLISCTKDENGRMKIETIKGSLCSDYTAISHVWAGGLGNELENSLPECQLKYLMSIVEELPQTRMRSFNAKHTFVSTWTRGAEKISQCGTILTSRWNRHRSLFWIDTLCIPVTKRQLNEAEPGMDYKSRAIASMAQLYAGARNVLVLDPELQHVPTALVQDNSKFLVALIKSSAWMGRSWTLQEGALAENLLFRFKDRSLPLGEASPREIGLPTVRMLDYDPENMKQYSDLKFWLPSKFSDVWNGLINRSTAQPKDVPAIFAAMIDLSADEILGIGRENSDSTAENVELIKELQMKAIIRAQARIPLAIFYQYGFTRNGTWSPKLPGSEFGNTRINEFYGTLQVTEDGLLLNEPLHTSALVVEGLPVLDQYILQLEGTNVIFYIHQEPAGDGSKFKPRSSTSLFILSKLCYVGSPMYQGARFSIIRREETGVTLKFEAAVAWVSYPISEECRNWVDSECEELERFGEKDYEVMIDVDINDGTWCKPEWRRNASFPFSTIGVSYPIAWWIAAIISMLVTWGAVLMIRASLIGKTWLGVFFFWEFWEQADFTDKVTSVIIGLRIFALDTEMAFWLKWLTAFAQQRWAASFYNSSLLSKRLLSSQHPPILMTFQTHSAFFATSAVLILAWIVSREDWMIVVATSFIFEPFVRVPFQLTVYQYSLKIAQFFSEGKNSLWALRILAFLLFAELPVFGVIDGLRNHKPWMVWSGGILFIFYPFMLWFDLYRDYFRLCCDRLPRETDEEELMYLGQFRPRE